MTSYDNNFIVLFKENADQSCVAASLKECKGFTNAKKNKRTINT